MQLIPLPDFEVDILNKVIGTHTFGDFGELKPKLHELVEAEKDNIVSMKKLNPNDFPAHRDELVNNMIQFLVRNEFYGIREGGVYFLTEKGKYLQQQKTLQQYMNWELTREDKLLQDMHTIETRGYLDEDQTFKKEHHAVVPEVEDKENQRHFGWYIVIIVILIALAAIGKSHKFW